MQEFVNILEKKAAMKGESTISQKYCGDQTIKDITGLNAKRLVTIIQNANVIN